MEHNVRGRHAPPSSFAARLGGWSVRHRKTAIIGWLLFLVAVTMIGGIAGQTEMKSYENGAGDSVRAERILADAGIKHPAGEMVIVHSAAPYGWRDAAEAVATGVKGTGLVENLKPTLASKDGHDGLVRFDMKGDAEKAADRVQPVLDAVGRRKAARPGVTIGQFGDASSGKWRPGSGRPPPRSPARR
jgi:RND superfamily putative drug exporter